MGFEVNWHLQYLQPRAPWVDAEFNFCFEIFNSRWLKNKLFLNFLMNTVYFIHESMLPLGTMC